MKQVKQTFLLAALALFAGACVVNMEDVECPAPVANDEERLVTLALSVPGIPASRGLTEDEESEVKTIDVLLFNTGNDYFYYRATGNIDKVSKKNFTVKLPGGTWNVVVLANAGEAFDKLVAPYKSLLSPATPAPVVSTVTRSDVLERLLLQLGDKTAKWPEGGFKGIPMWGYCTLAVNPGTPAPAANIDLTRAIARVNVSVVDEDASDSYNVQDVFELASVRLYNYSRAGSIAPAAVAGGTGYDGAQWDGNEATLPNLPALSLLVDASTPLKVPGALLYNVPAEQKHDYSGEIYTFEAAAGAGTTLSTNTCLVIGGKYNGVLSYYRVDFAKNDGTYLPLLRNHSYNVKIIEVLAAGYASVDEAFDNKPSNIKVEISEDDGTIGHVVFDDQNYLGANTGEIVIQGKPYTGKQFTVSTDVTDGWEITGKDGDWITINSPSSLSGGPGKENVTFSASVNNTGARRVGYIHFQAGRLTLDVKITQLGVGVWIMNADDTQEIQELVFNSTGVAQSAEEGFVVHWVPVEAQVNAMMIPVSQRPAFDYDPDHDTPGEGAMTDVSDLSGYASLTVQPTALTAAEFDAFIEKASLVRFVAFHDGDFAPADIKLCHVDYHIIADVDVIYGLNSYIVQSFTVRSNTTWAVSNVSDPGTILASYTPSLSDQSGSYNITGDKVYFKLVDDESKDGKTVTLTLYEPDGFAEEVDVTIKAAACGIDGIAVSKHIGSGNYLTYMYNSKCWMVENSKEGTYSGRAFGQNANGQPIYSADVSNDIGKQNGYYYTYAQAKAANNACPTGWHLFTDAEANSLVTAVNNDKPGIGKWWTMASYNALSGCLYTGTHQVAGTWAHFSTHGFWWGSEALGIRCESGRLDTPEGYSTHGTWYWFPVRCVHN